MNNAENPFSRWWKKQDEMLQGILASSGVLMGLVAFALAINASGAMDYAKTILARPTDLPPTPVPTRNGDCVVKTVRGTIFTGDEFRPVGGRDAGLLTGKNLLQDGRVIPGLGPDQAFPLQGVVDVSNGCWN